MSQPYGSPLLELRLFGQPSVHVQGKDITPLLPKKGVLLLALLALRTGKPEDRSRVAGMLWPDALEGAALHSLRQLLAKVRHELGEAREVVLSPTPRTMALEDSKEIKVDLLEFDEACAAAAREDLERAVALYREPLLNACHEPFAALARESRQQAFLKAADTLAHMCLGANDHQAAVGVLRRVVEEDPYREPACRALMSALAATGQWPAALETYRDFRARFRRDLRADVGPETKELYRSIRQQEFTEAKALRKSGFLPSPITPLIGRQSAVEEVISLLNLCRLVTLTGAGGAGKTRLAIAVAKELDERYLDGGGFIDLAPVRDPSGLPMAVAVALNLPEVPGKTRMESLVEHLAPREQLLVFDNCEHLSKEVAHVVESLLVAASGLRILATSRQRLGLPGEQVYSVPGLRAPSPEDPLPAIVESDAVRLFLARARRPIREKDEKEMAAAASICRRLDGLPLAIELAAARTNVFSPSEIERRLDHRFALLTTGAASPAKHQTLRACMEWSWELLSSEEKDLLMAMSTFRGGGTLEMVAGVAPEGVGHIEDLLGSLIDKSLVSASEVGGRTRYTLLETIREFAEHMLEESGRKSEALDRHRDYLLAWVEAGYRRMDSVEEAKKFAAYEVEHDNCLAAIAWCHRQKDRAKAIRMCAALSRFWDTHGHLTEGKAQLEYALRFNPPDLSEETLSRAWVHLGWMATVQGECEAAVGCYNKALAIVKKLGDRDAVGVILTCVANAHLLGNELDNARAALLESLEIVRETEPNGGAMILCNLAEVAFGRDDLEEAEQWLEATARSLGEVSAERASTSATYLRHMAFLAYRKGDFPASRDYALRALQMFQGAGLLVEIPFAMLVVALAEGGMGNWNSGATLFGACERAIEQDNLVCPGYLARARDASLKLVARELTQAELEASLESGRSTSVAGALEAIWIPS